MKNNTAKRYNKIKLTVSLSEMAISLFFWLIIITFDFNEQFAQLSTAISSVPYIQFLFFLLLLGIIYSAIGLPLNFYSGFWIEKKFKLTNQTISAWFIEQLKSVFVSIILGGIVLTVFYYLLNNFSERWWFYLWLFFLLFGVLLSHLAPLIIFPLFYKFKPVENEDVKETLKTFAEKWKFKFKGIYQFNLSKTTNKANAAFTGIGKTKRIILGDTLLSNFSLEEIETIFAHEVGHYLKKHILKGIIFNSILSFTGIYIIFKLYQAACTLLDYSQNQLDALPILALVFVCYGLISGPINNFISRKFEFEADAFAVESTGKTEAFKNSLEKLSRLNLSDENPHPLVEFLFYSHPSIKNRIAKLTGA